MQMKNVKAGDLRFFYRSVKQRDILGAAEMALVRIVRFSFPPFSKKEDAIIMNNGK
jgi:predicted RNA-binding protein with PUA-like domain